MTSDKGDGTEHEVVVITLSAENAEEAAKLISDAGIRDDRIEIREAREVIDVER